MEGEADFFYKMSKGVDFTHSNAFFHKLYLLTLLHPHALKRLLALDLYASKWSAQDHWWGTRDAGS